MDLEDADIEFLFSEQDEVDKETIFALEITELGFTSTDETNTDVSDMEFLSIHATFLCSSAQLAILTLLV